MSLPGRNKIQTKNPIVKNWHHHLFKIYIEKHYCYCHPLIWGWNLTIKRVWIFMGGWTWHSEPVKQAQFTSSGGVLFKLFFCITLNLSENGNLFYMKPQIQKNSKRKSNHSKWEIPQQCMLHSRWYSFSSSSSWAPWACQGLTSARANGTWAWRSRRWWRREACPSAPRCLSSLTSTSSQSWVSLPKRLWSSLSQLLSSSSSLLIADTNKTFILATIIHDSLPGLKPADDIFVEVTNFLFKSTWGEKWHSDEIFHPYCWRTEDISSSLWPILIDTRIL